MADLQAALFAANERIEALSAELESVRTELTESNAKLSSWATVYAELATARAELAAKQTLAEHYRCALEGSEIVKAELQEANDTQAACLRAVGELPERWLRSVFLHQACLGYERCARELTAALEKITPAHADSDAIHVKTDTSPDVGVGRGGKAVDGQPNQAGAIPVAGATLSAEGGRERCVRCGVEMGMLHGFAKKLADGCMLCHGCFLARELERAPSAPAAGGSGECPSCFKCGELALRGLYWGMSPVCTRCEAVLYNDRLHDHGAGRTAAVGAPSKVLPRCYCSGSHLLVDGRCPACGSTAAAEAGGVPAVVGENADGVPDPLTVTREGYGATVLREQLREISELRAKLAAVEKDIHLLEAMGEAHLEASRMQEAEVEAAESRAEKAEGELVQQFAYRRQLIASENRLLDRAKAAEAERDALNEVLERQLTEARDAIETAASRAEKAESRLKIAEGEVELYRAQASIATGSIAEIREALGIGPNTYCPDHIRELIEERDSYKRMADTGDI